MLQISRQAVTEEDAEAVLNASYLVRKPFGVPVMFVDPLEFKPKRFWGMSFFSKKAALRSIESRLEDTRRQCEPPSPALPGAPGPQPVAIADHGYSTIEWDKVGPHVLRHVKNYHRYGDQIMALACPLAAPRMSVVMLARIEDYKREEASYVLFINKEHLPPLPGYDAQHQFLSLWHEIAHSVAGDNEAGADLTSAMAYRHAFADRSVLTYHGDLRAANLVFLYDSLDATEIYGWSCVEAFDSVAAMETPPSRDDVYSIGCRSHDVPTLPRGHAIRAVGGMLCKSFAEAFVNRDLAALSKAADQMVDTGMICDPDATAIARRFGQAMRRLSIGRDAY